MILCIYCYTHCPQPWRRPPPTHASAGDSWTLWASLGQSLWGHCSFLLSPGAHKVLFVPSKSLFPSPVQVLAALWWGQWWPPLRGLSTQVCWTQSSSPYGSPLLTRTSTGDAQTQSWLSFCGDPGSWCAQGLFEPSEHLWWEWGLILNTNSPLLLFFWGFSFALGRGVSSHGHSSATQLPLQCLPSYWGFSDLGCGVSPHHHSSATQLPFQRHMIDTN